MLCFGSNFKLSKAGSGKVSVNVSNPPWLLLPVHSLCGFVSILKQHDFAAAFLRTYTRVQKTSTN